MSRLPGTATVPPGLVGAALLLWGWQTGALVLAVPMAIVLEAAPRINWRWELGDTEFHRVADFSTLLLIGWVLYQFDQQSVRGVFGVIRGLPAILWLLLAAQVFSTRGRIAYTALFLSVRRRAARLGEPDTRSVDLRPAYVVACLIAASAGEVRPTVFFIALSGLVAWGLWRVRSPRYHPALWGAALILAGSAAFALGTGIVVARAHLEPVVMDWMREWIRHGRDPFRTQTALGHIGTLKLSDRILVGGRPDPGERPPSLLREASYQLFGNNTWLAGGARFSEILPDAEGTVWALRDAVEPARGVTVWSALPRGRGLLPAPGGAFRFESLPVEDLSHNGLGAFKVARGPELVNYRVLYGPGAGLDASPGDQDLRVPPEYRKVMAEVVSELGLADLAPAEAARRLERHFATEFRYTLAGSRRVSGKRPLTRFLRETRAGHCEYFASATVLLLRAAGIPARYAAGFAVQEYSVFEEAYVVRRRHAHSWALAWVDGGWRDLDTTPAAWLELETDSAPWWEPAYDMVAWAVFQFLRWRWSGTESGLGTGMAWLALPLTVLLVWSISRRRRVARRGEAPADMRGERAPCPGSDSEMYLVEQRLAALGHRRKPGEPVGAWLRSLSSAGLIDNAGDLLDTALPLHYRHRFDPRGLGPEERRALREVARGWLERNGRAVGRRHGALSRRSPTGL